MDDRDDKNVVVIERSDGGLGAFLFGLAMGAGAALLLAPRAGEETRRELRNQGRRLRTSAVEKAEDLQELLSGGYEEARSRVERGVNTARDTMQLNKDSAKDAVEAGRAVASSAREELERRLSEAKSSRARTRSTNAPPDDPPDAS